MLKTYLFRKFDEVPVASLILVSLFLSGCTNFRSSLQSALSSGSTTIVTPTYDNYTITNTLVGTASTSSSGTPTYPLTIYVNTSTSTGNDPLTTVCTAPSSGSTQDTSTLCYCSFSWSEVNTSTSPATTIPHSVQTAITSVTNGTIVCTMPSTFSTIATGTAIGITVVGASSNSHVFTFNPATYKVGQSSSTGDFVDSQGQYFANILRYSCYGQEKHGLSLVNALGKMSITNFSSTFPIGNQFCTLNSDGSTVSPTTGGSGSITTSCPAMSSLDYTAQAYYYNLYISDTAAGDINGGNNRFVCPMVKESLNSDGNVGSSGKYWPLDSSFALSVSATTTFNVGVTANSKTSNPSDPTSNNTTCGSSASTAAAKDSLVTSCLGYAATPNADGTCPSITSSSGTTIQTYRLRRYFALYPLRYEANGNFISEPQQIDTIYVVDRPVTGPTGLTTALGNPVTYTMLGPKPCPFAYFDRNGVVTGTPSYEATNNAGWNAKNVDGIAFPNTDSSSSCSATLPLVNANQSLMSTTTISPYNPAYKTRYVRPIQAWSPHYVEDTKFLACAPLAQPLRDPPLHFAKTASGNVSYCAEVYPSQNDNYQYLDTHAVAGSCVATSNPSAPYSGAVAPYTSHLSKNTAAGGNCTATIPADVPTGVANWCSGSSLALHPSGTAAYGVLNVGLTCDRTVVNPTGGPAWPRFPLLAPPSDVENALSGDSTFNCTVTSDAGGSSTKVGTLTPTQGCCGNPSTGVSPVLVTTGVGGTSTAHLEPDPTSTHSTLCQAPNY